jgi:hypothetical protein
MHTPEDVHLAEAQGYVLAPASTSGSLPAGTCSRLIIGEPYGYVTTTRAGAQFFYPHAPYLDNAVACEALYTLAQVRQAINDNAMNTSAKL